VPRCKTSGPPENVVNRERTEQEAGKEEEYPAGPYSWRCAGVPGVTIPASSAASQFVSRMHP
jgi:hypothetical protein